MSLYFYICGFLSTTLPSWAPDFLPLGSWGCAQRSGCLQSPQAWPCLHSGWSSPLSPGECFPQFPPRKFNLINSYNTLQRSQTSHWAVLGNRISLQISQEQGLRKRQAHLPLLAALTTCTGNSQPVVGLAVQKHSVLFWWGLQSIHFLEWGPAAGKGPQDLRGCRNSARCSCKKRETERSVTTSGSHAPGLLEVFSPSENWRQMGTSCFVHLHHLLSFSNTFQIQWTRKELEGERAQNKWTLPQVSHKGLFFFF